jgi:hypothetical protein
MDIVSLLPEILLQKYFDLSSNLSVFQAIL